MNPYYFSIGGLVWIIALFKRELLIERKTFRIILVISIALFLTGLVHYFTAAGRYPGSGALLSPLLSLGVFRLFRSIFLMRLKREPRDTWLNWGEGMGADRVFNIMYFVLAAWLWIFVAVVMS